MLPCRLAACRLAGQDPGAAPGPVAHAVRDVLPRAGHRKASGAVYFSEIDRAVRHQVLLRIRKLAPRLEAPAQVMGFVSVVVIDDDDVPRVFLQAGKGILACIYATAGYCADVLRCH